MQNICQPFLMSFSKNRQIYSFLCAHVHWNEGVLAPPTHIPCLSLAQKNKNQRKCLFFSHFFKKTIDNSACLCYDIQARKGKTTKYAPVAQQVEHLTFNQRVWSSNLHRVTKKIMCLSGGIGRRKGLKILRV